MTREEFYREIGPYIVRAAQIAPKNRVTICHGDFGFTTYIMFGSRVIAASATPGGWDRARAEAAFEQAKSSKPRSFTWLTDQLPYGPPPEWRHNDDPQAQG